jgi:DNA-directed RNA polymerase subunit N (RpoN/RPB10)
MIIPVKCFTCGKVLADKYRYYKRQVRLRKNLNLEENEDDVLYLTQLNKEKTIEGIVLDELKLDKMCCRRHMLTHVDIE